MCGDTLYPISAQERFLRTTTAILQRVLTLPWFGGVS